MAVVVVKVTDPTMGANPFCGSQDIRQKPVFVRGDW